MFFTPQNQFLPVCGSMMSVEKTCCRVTLENKGWFLREMSFELGCEEGKNLRNKVPPAKERASLVDLGETRRGWYPCSLTGSARKGQWESGLHLSATGGYEGVRVRRCHILVPRAFSTREKAGIVGRVQGNYRSQVFRENLGLPREQERHTDAAQNLRAGQQGSPWRGSKEFTSAP